MAVVVIVIVSGVFVVILVITLFFLYRRRFGKSRNKEETDSLCSANPHTRYTESTRVGPDLTISLDMTYMESPVIHSSMLDKYSEPSQNDDAPVELLPPESASENFSSSMELQHGSGQLNFVLNYERESSELAVTVIRPPAPPEEDPLLSNKSYVKCWLEPYTEQRMRTKLLFSVDPSELDSKTAHFQVYSTDEHSRDRLVGETNVSLADLNVFRPVRVLMDLRDTDERAAENGELLFSLKYSPGSNKLTVVVIRARYLKWLSQNQGGDCFAQVCLMKNGKKARKKKSAMVIGAIDPSFNAHIIFSLPSAISASLQFRLSVVERLPNGTLSSLGEVIVGPQLDGPPQTHWRQMMASVGRPVEMWHSLPAVPRLWLVDHELFITRLLLTGDQGQDPQGHLLPSPPLCHLVMSPQLCRLVMSPRYVTTAMSPVVQL